MLRERKIPSHSSEPLSHGKSYRANNHSAIDGLDAMLFDAILADKSTHVK